MMSTENTTVVETHGLSKRFGRGVLAVDGVDMSVRRGEVYGFLGPNGAGKTTTLKMLVGLIGATSGTATVAGHAPGDPAGLAKIGCLIEGPGFYPYLSGRAVCYRSSSRSGSRTLAPASLRWYSSTNKSPNAAQEHWRSTPQALTWRSAGPLCSKVKGRAARR